jgi:hypothetical protein
MLMIRSALDAPWFQPGKNLAADFIRLRLHVFARRHLSLNSAKSSVHRQGVAPASMFPDCVNLAQGFAAADLIRLQTMKTRPFAKPSLTLFSALRDVRAPLISLTVMAFLFQALLPVAAAGGSPQVLAAMSICLGAADGDEGNQPDQSGACLCGSACAHPGCFGCLGSARPGSELAEALRIEAWKIGIVEPERHQRRATAQSRAPPAFS